MIVRGVVGWGGKGVRGDTDRIASRILGGIMTNILASQYAMGLTAVDRPVPAAGRGGLVCAHCGFASAHERAFYCPKCGMRLLRDPRRSPWLHPAPPRNRADPRNAPPRREFPDRRDPARNRSLLAPFMAATRKGASLRPTRAPPPPTGLPFAPQP